MELLNVAGRFLRNRLDDLDDYETLSSFVTAFPSALTEEQLSTVRTEFLEFCEHYDGPSGPDELRNSADDIDRIGHELKAEVEQFSAELRRRAEEWESEADPEPDPPDFEDEPELRAGVGDEQAIDDMFERLREELNLRS